MTPIPYSITYYVKKCLIRKIVTVVLLTAALAVLFSLYGREIFGESASPALIAVLSVALSLVPFLVSGLPKRLLDRSLEGEVVEITSKLSHKGTGRGGRRITDAPRGLYGRGGVYVQYARIRSYYLVVKTENGKRRRVPIGSVSVMQHNPFASLYHIGDRVGHVAGTEGVYVIHGQNNSFRHCIICDTHGSTDDTECNCCGMPYVIPKQ